MIKMEKIWDMLGLKMMLRFSPNQDPSLSAVRSQKGRSIYAILHIKPTKPYPLPVLHHHQTTTPLLRLLFSSPRHETQSCNRAASSNPPVHQPPAAAPNGLILRCATLTSPSRSARTGGRRMRQPYLMNRAEAARAPWPPCRGRRGGRWIHHGQDSAAHGKGYAGSSTSMRREVAAPEHGGSLVHEQRATVHPAAHELDPLSAQGGRWQHSSFPRPPLCAPASFHSEVL